MKSTVTVRLDEDLHHLLGETAERLSRSRSDIVRQALSDYLFERKFRMLRRRMISRAQAQGVFTDEDVFREVS